MFANVATPFTAAALRVPASVSAPGLFPIASATVSVAVLTRLPSESRNETWMGGVIACPAVVVNGWTSKTSCVGWDGSTSNATLVAEVRPVALATSV